MSELWGHLVGVAILMMMAVFIGIWIWAWRPRHRAVFESMSEIPMRESDANRDWDGFADMAESEGSRLEGSEREGSERDGGSRVDHRRSGDSELRIEAGTAGGEGR